jgi:hypothetical protein
MKTTATTILYFYLAILPILAFSHNVYAVSQYDSDGFTIFPTKSSDYMSGYRAGVIQADKDVQNFEKLGGIDAHQENIKCPANITGDMCLGYKDGYSDEAMDQLE